MSAYWRFMGAHLVQGIDEHREGAAVIALLKDVIHKHLKGNLLDFGCGKGRMAQLFSPLIYLGYDINPKMIHMARQYNPDYSFTQSIDEALFYSADTIMLYTVISMWDDAEAREMIQRLRARCIIIGEIADKRWASPDTTSPRIYNRDVNEIDAILNEAGYMQVEHHQSAHERYAKWNNDYDKNMHILVYERFNG